MCEDLQKGARLCDSVQGFVSAWKDVKEHTRTCEGVQCHAIACKVVGWCVRMYESI